MQPYRFDVLRLTYAGPPPPGAPLIIRVPRETRLIPSNRLERLAATHPGVIGYSNAGTE